MNKKRILWGVVGIAVVAIVVAVALRPKREKSVQPEYKPLIEAVYASGNIAPKNEYKVCALGDGVVIKKFVSEGDSVEAGQILFQLDNEEQAVRRKSAAEVFSTARGNYGETSPALQELSAQLATARAKFRTDSLQYARSKDLYDSRSLTQADYDRALLAFQASQNELLAAERRYQTRKRQLFVELQNAESQYRTSAKQETNFIVRSALRGMVYETYKSEGDLARRNEAVALVGSPDSVTLKLGVDELDINKVKVGQEALVKFDVYKDRIFKARVTKIYPTLNKQDQSFRVDAEFTEPLPLRFVGLSAEANIVVSQKDRALVIPRALLLAGDSVLVRSEDGGKRKIKIQKGSENFEWVEVLHGLDTSARLVIGK